MRVLKKEWGGGEKESKENKVSSSQKKAYCWFDDGTLWGFLGSQDFLI